MTATVTVIGVDGRSLPVGAAPAVAAARLVVGRRALLETYAREAGRTVELASPATVSAEVRDALTASVRAGEPAVVLASGDPGFFGVLRQIRESGLPTVCLPSVSCLQRVAALIQRPWDDVSVVSAHGLSFLAAVNVCRARRAVAVVTAPGAGPAELGAALSGWRRTLVVLEDFGGPAEKL